MNSLTYSNNTMFSNILFNQSLGILAHLRPDPRFLFAKAACGIGSQAGQCLSLAHYVTGIGPMDGATAVGGRSCCLSSRRCPQSFPF